MRNGGENWMRSFQMAFCLLLKLFGNGDQSGMMIKMKDDDIVKLIIFSTEICCQARLVVIICHQD